MVVGKLAIRPRTHTGLFPFDPWPSRNRPPLTTAEAVGSPWKNALAADILESQGAMKTLARFAKVVDPFFKPLVEL